MAYCVNNHKKWGISRFFIKFVAKFAFLKKHINYNE